MTLDFLEFLFESILDVIVLLMVLLLFVKDER